MCTLCGKFINPQYAEKMLLSRNLNEMLRSPNPSLAAADAHVAETEDGALNAAAMAAAVSAVNTPLAAHADAPERPRMDGDEEADAFDELLVDSESKQRNTSRAMDSVMLEIQKNQSIAEFMEMKTATEALVTNEMALLSEL